MSERIQGMVIGALCMALGVLVGSLLATSVAASRPAPESTPPASPRAQYDGAPVPLPSSETPARTGRPWPELRVAIAAPSPSAVPGAASPVNMAPAVVVPTAVGVATWFKSPGGVSAAGPDLRRALGPGWRGTSVQVCGRRCASTVLGDWMAADKLIDLDDDLFRVVCGPLSRGICKVEVRA